MRILILVCALLFAVSAHAAETNYLGSWKFTQAVEAPWATSDMPPDASDKTRLMGSIITFKPNEIAGPQPFACKAPHYELKDNVSAEMLFEGAFDEMHQHNPAIDPVEQAHIVGFQGTAWQTLDTGCDIDIHFANPTTAKVGLNNYVYTLKKK